MVVEAPHPFQGCRLDLLDPPFGAVFLNQFGFEQGEPGASQNIVVTAIFRPNGRGSAKFCD